MDPRTEKALSTYTQSLARDPTVRSIFGLILYGSRARGDHNSPPIFTSGGKMVESDIDVAVVMRGQRPARKDVARIEYTLFDLTVEALDVSEGLMLDPIAVWESDLQNPLKTTHPNLYLSIIREGIEWNETL